MWNNIENKKPETNQHVYVWNGEIAKLMLWDGNRFAPPKYEHHMGMDGKLSYGFVSNNFKLWFEIQPPNIMDEISA